MSGSSDGDGSSSGWGLGMEAFERGAEEHVRLALLKMDMELLREEEEEQEAAKTVEEDFLRYIPGDPFANEEPDYDSWRRRFTYLCIVGTSIGHREGGGVTASECSAGIQIVAGPPPTPPASSSLPSPSVFVGSPGAASECGIDLRIIGVRAQQFPQDPAHPVLEEDEEEYLARDGVLEEWIAVDRREDLVAVDDEAVLTEIRDEIVEGLLDDVWDALVPDILAAVSQCK